MIATTKYYPHEPERFSFTRPEVSLDALKSSRVMSQVTADYDRGILTLRGSVCSVQERQFAQEAYTALSERRPVRNLIKVVKSPE